MLLSGQRPPDLTGAFRVAWLGCDAAFTPAVIAAVHPTAEVLAWDPDPGKLATVRCVGDDADLANLVPQDRPAPPVPDQRKFDIVVIDGLVDSVPDVERSRLIAAAAALLRPGGVACITYRTAVGWSEISPLVQLLQYLARHPQRDRFRAVEEVKSLLHELRERKITYFARPAVGGWLDDLLEMSTSDIIDHYVDRDLRPVSHALVDELLSVEGAMYVGSTDPEASLRDSLSPNLDRQLRGAESTLLGEVLGDLARRRAYRSDLFCLGPVPLSARERTRQIGRLRVIGLADGSEPTATRDRWAGLKSRQREEELRHALGSGVVHPLVAEPVSPAAADAATRLSGVLAEPSVPVAQRCVVVPSLGTAVPALVPATTSLPAKLERTAR